LPAPQEVKIISEGSRHEKLTHIEQRVLRIWQELLGTNQSIGPRIKFNHIGGNSLLSMALRSRIIKEFDVELTLREVLDRPTIRSLANCIRGSNTNQRMEQLKAIKVAKQSSRGILSFAQERLWVVDHLIAEKGAYNIPVALSIQGELDSAVLEKSLQCLINRHETLRTQFVNENGFVSQKILEKVDSPLVVKKVNGEEETAQLVEVQKIIEEDVKLAFRLDQAPLIRAQLLKLNSKSHVLVVMMHHVISDGWSIGVMGRELSHIYNALKSGSENDLPELSIQYADFAVWQRQWLSGKVLRQQLKYWKHQLDGVPQILQLPLDYSRPIKSTFKGASINKTISKYLNSKIKKVCNVVFVFIDGIHSVAASKL